LQQAVKKVVGTYGIRHKIATPYHLQTNGQVEVFNRECKKILEKTTTCSRKDWALKIDDALWAYITTFKTTTGLTAFQLVLCQILSHAYRG